MFTEKAKHFVDRHEIISFDIFDTLLLRPYLRPTDLFVHLEKLNHLPGFALRRRQAEKQARRKRTDLEDITFDEIYAELSGPDAALKEQELALERQTLQANPVVQQIFNYAKQQGKKIIIVSDMYLSASFLAQVLQEKGFTGFDKLYVSSEVRKQKGSGALFRHVQHELQVNPATILHIGDNRRSDVRRAQKAGWHALHCKAAQTAYFEHYPSLRKFWEQNTSFEASVTLGLLVLRHAAAVSPEYFADLGYRIGGPAAYGFTRWIEERAIQQAISNLFFVARDGYSLQKIFQTFENPHIQSHYVYALRFLNNICRLDYPPTSMSQMKTILHYFAAKSTEIKALLPTRKMNKTQAHRFIEDHRPILAPLAQQELTQYAAYLSAYYQPGQGIGVVDSMTAFFSSQKLIEAVVGKQHVTGFYWAVHADKKTPVAFERFVPLTQEKNNSHTLTHHWPFMEFLFTAPQPPVKQITPDGQPLYGTEIAPEEKTRIAAYQSLSGGMLEFAREVKRIFGGKNIFLTGEFLVKWVNWFLLHPTRTDKREMAHIFHASGSDHKEYEPLLSFQPTLRQMLSHPKQYILFAKQVYWKTLMQFLLTCLLSPTALEQTDGQYVLYFFPRLCKQYFRKNISLGKCTLTVAWGRRHD